MKTLKDKKSGPKMAQTMAQTGQSIVGRRSKDHQDYWRDRLVVRSYRDRDGDRIEMPEWHIRIAHNGRREWFNLNSANQAVAAVKARDIYRLLAANGWEETLAKYKPDPVATAPVCTVGEFLADVKARSHLKPMTVRRYAVKLRKLVADVAMVEAGMKLKAKRAKYDYAKGGHKAWLAKVDAERLDVLTPEAINAWRNRYVAKAGNDSILRKSAERSAASYVRCARSLFAADVVAVLKVKLPPNPFEGVKLKDPGPQRYQSDVNPAWLLGCAERELREKHPQQYLALYLCLWAGLRRREADLLLWEQIDLENGTLHVRRTVHFEPKTEESQRLIDLSPVAVDALRRFKEGKTSEFVLEGSDPRPSSTYDFYRCDSMWRELVDWLKGKGVRQKKAIHALRKESGSLIAANYGIEDARRHLGHRNISLTSSYYVDKRKRVEVTLDVPVELRSSGGVA